MEGRIRKMDESTLRSYIWNLTPEERTYLRMEIRSGNLLRQFENNETVRRSNRPYFYHKPDSIILDEAHRIKNPKSANFKSIKRLTNVPIRYALTGTPSPNKAEEIWSILHFIDKTQWPSYWNFAKEYFKVVRVPYGNQHLEIGNFKPGKNDNYKNT